MQRIEINNFLGEATDRNKWTKEMCQECKNFDLREVKGRLTSRLGYSRKYPAPTIPTQLSNVTFLRFENISFTADGLEEECILQIGKGTISSLDAGNTSIDTLDIGLFWIRPYYNGSAWVREWLWLNETYLTIIDNQLYNKFDINGLFNSAANYFAKFSIYSITKDKYAEIYKSDYQDINHSEIYLVSYPAGDRTLFANKDTVIVTRNYIPYADLLEYYNVTAEQISIHKILGDFRIGFGGEANRLALMIGYRKKSFQMNTGGPLGALIQNVAEYNGIILAPYNSLTEDTKASGSWGNTAAFHLYGDPASAGTGTYHWWPRLTVVLDGYEEFVIPFNFFEQNGVTDPLGSPREYMEDASTGYDIDFKFRLFWGLFNKRIKSVKLYLSRSSNTVVGIDYLDSDFHLVKEWIVSAETFASGDYNLDEFGYLYNTAMFEFNEEVWNAKGNAIGDQLGYVPAYGDLASVASGIYPGAQYARGYDHALAIKGQSYFASPYIERRWENYVLFSPISGDGAFQYDIAVFSSYLDFENQDANLIKAIALLPNLDLATFKQNSFQRGNTIGFTSSDMFPGMGIDTKRSLVNLNKGIAICSQHDIWITDGSQRMNISAGKISDQFRAISDKSLIFATREEKEDAYRFFNGDSLQYLFAMEEWVRIATYLNPDDFSTAKDGTVYFMTDGIIWYQHGYTDHNANNVSQNIPLTWRSIKFDITKLDQNVKGLDRFYVLSVFMKYSASNNFTVNVYKEGTLFKALTFSSGYTYQNKVLPHGCLGKYIELEVTADINAKATIEAIGFYWKPMTYREYV